jgi:hypothetical protein
MMIIIATTTITPIWITKVISVTVTHNITPHWVPWSTATENPNPPSDPTYINCLIYGCHFTPSLTLSLSLSQKPALSLVLRLNLESLSLSALGFPSLPSFFPLWAALSPRPTCSHSSLSVLSPRLGLVPSTQTRYHPGEAWPSRPSRLLACGLNMTIAYPF